MSKRSPFGNDDDSGLGFLAGLLGLEEDSSFGSNPFREARGGGNPFESARSAGLGDLLGMFRDSMKRSTGLNSEVMELLEPVAVDPFKIINENAGAKVVAEESTKLLTERLQKLAAAVVKLGSDHAEALKKIDEDHQKCHEEWRKERSSLYNELNPRRSASESIDYRLGELIYRLSAGDEISSEDLIETLESFRDTFSDTDDEVNYRNRADDDSDTDYPTSRKELRMQAKAAAAEAAAAETTDPDKSDKNEEAAAGVTG